MQYNHLGKSGLRVSALSLGSWVTYHNQVDVKLAAEMLAAAYDAGVNFFDNAEAYALGKSEEIMGAALRQLGWPRLNYIVSTKFFWGIDRSVPAERAINRRDTLNRKYLMQAIDGSLKRLGLEHVDLVYCHRPDPTTPVEETARAMNDIIVAGKALYWGTSEWPAEAIRTAWQLADRHGWHKPLMEQPQYHLFHRKRVEVEYRHLYHDIGLGLTTWSPLASGLLTGKYANGVPKDSRGAIPRMAFLVDGLTDRKRNDVVKTLAGVARELGCTLPQLAIAWCAKNPHVSTVITGASRVEQVKENLKALEVLPKLTPPVMDRLLEIVAAHDDPG